MGGVTVDRISGAMMAVLATTRAAMAAEGVPRGVGRGEAVFQSPRAAQRTASLTLSVASPTPSKPPRAETPPKAVLPASRSTSSRQEILEKVRAHAKQFGSSRPYESLG